MSMVNDVRISKATMSVSGTRNVLRGCYGGGKGAVLLGVVCSSLLTGCASRSLTVRQQDYINTAMHRDRDAEKRTGEPLRVDVVCVYPSDLQKGGNQLLNPESRVTSDYWFDNGAGNGKISIPADQIYVLSDNSNEYGTVKHPSLRGAKQDGKSEVTIKGLKFKEKRGWKEGGALLAKEAVIYVFPKFTNKEGKVMDIPPAKFYPPSKYSKNMIVEIGVEDDKSTPYIRIVQ